MEFLYQLAGDIMEKIYSFDINETKNYYVGSSNFSPSGLKSNKEFLPCLLKVVQSKRYTKLS